MTEKCKLCLTKQNELFRIFGEKGNQLNVHPKLIKYLDNKVLNNFFFIFLILLEFSTIDSKCRVQN